MGVTAAGEDLASTSGSESEGTSIVEATGPESTLSTARAVRVARRDSKTLALMKTMSGS